MASDVTRVEPVHFPGHVPLLRFIFLAAKHSRLKNTVNLALMSWRMTMSAPSA